MDKMAQGSAEFRTDGPLSLMIAFLMTGLGVYYTDSDIDGSAPPVMVSLVERLNVIHEVWEGSIVYFDIICHKLFLTLISIHTRTQFLAVCV